MNPQFNAIWEAHRFFKKEGIPYVLIGGIALQWWGEPRFTRDVDVTILVETGEIIERFEKPWRKLRTK